MAGKRSYDDGSPTARALELVGERWALLVACELLFGPRRFSDLQAALRTISPNVLTQRLAELEAARIIVHRRLPAPAASWVYELTPWGLELEPILIGLGLWASRANMTLPERPMSAASAMLSLRALAQAAEGPRFDLRVDLADQSFHLRLGRQRLRVEAWEGGHADAVLTAAPNVFDHLIREGRDLQAAVRSGAIEWTGDRKAFERLLTLVPIASDARPAFESAPD
jgi:DNA-binding HxlR family transcriptional regulator